MMTLELFLVVAVGGFIGAPSRYLLDRPVTRRVESDLPWGTFLVNISGSFVLGLLTGRPSQMLKIRFQAISPLRDSPRLQVVQKKPNSYYLKIILVSFFNYHRGQLSRLGNVAKSQDFINLFCFVKSRSAAIRFDCCYLSFGFID